ncbi:MAG: hypothetical protein HFI93_04220 [Lachnospiraceae bacterium]|nr:hypothetical protein [Lachnospiraceae bacterium]
MKKFLSGILCTCILSTSLFQSAFAASVVPAVEKADTYEVNEGTPDVEKVGDNVFLISNLEEGDDSQLVYNQENNEVLIMSGDEVEHLITKGEDGNIYMDGSLVLELGPTVTSDAVPYRIGANPFGSDWSYYNTWYRPYKFTQGTQITATIVSGILLSAFGAVGALAGIASSIAGIVQGGQMYGYFAGDQYENIIHAYKSRVFVYKNSNYTGYLGYFDTAVSEFPR